MTTPFGTPLLWLVARDRPSSLALELFVRGVACAGQHEFSQTDVLVAPKREDLHRKLDLLPLADRFNLLCIVDMRDGNFAFDFNRDYHPLRPSELVMVYPEVYWVFVLASKPDATEIVERENRQLHFELEQLAKSATAQDEHANSVADEKRQIERRMDEVMRRSVLLAQLTIPTHFVDNARLADLLTPLTRHANGFRCLFDASALRNNILFFSRRASAEALRFAVVFEDEAAYCLFNGYLLFRRGYCTFLVNTLHEYLQVTQMGWDIAPEWLVCEDVELVFADAEVHDLGRHCLLPTDGNVENCLIERSRQARLHRAKTRLIVSALRIDESHLRTADPIQTVLFRNKPFDGFYDRDIIASVSPQLAAPNRPSALTRLDPIDFILDVTRRCWDCFVPSQANTAPAPVAIVATTTSGHSAPGKNQAFATAILWGTGPLSSNNLEELLSCGVRAFVASSLLNNRTAHLALESLQLRHQMEVKAECRFVGVSNRLDVYARIAEIEAEVERIVGFRWHDLSRKRWKRNEQRCNGMVKLCSVLREVYHAHGHSDEAEEVLSETRKWRRLGYVSEFDSWHEDKSHWAAAAHLSRAVLRRVNGTLWWYVNIVLSAWWKLLVACIFWVGLFAGGFYCLCDGLPVTEPIHARFGNAYWLYHSAAAFTGLQQKVEGGFSGEDISREIDAARALVRSKPLGVNGLAGSDKPDVRSSMASASIPLPRPTGVEATMFTQYAESLSRRLRFFSILTLFELTLGYMHLGIFIALFIQEFTGQ